MEKLEVLGPWSGTEGEFVDPKGKVSHRSARAKAPREEKLKEAETELDGEMPQEESAEIRSPKRKVIRERKLLSCRAPSTNHEDPFIGATIDAVKKPSDTGRLRQWLLKRVEKPTQSILCQQCHNEQLVQARQAATEIVAMERSSGKESASSENLEWEMSN